MTYVSWDRFQDHLDICRKAETLSVDTEGTITHPHSETWGLSLSGNRCSEYYAFNHMFPGNLPQEWLRPLQEVIVNHPRVVMHNAKHDIRALQNLDIDIQNLDNWYCTMMMAHMNNENYASKKLDWLSRHFGGMPKRNEEVMQAVIKGFGWDWLPVEIMRPYGADDALITEDLFYSLYPSFQEQGFDGDLWNWERRFTRFLIELENTGILVDQDLSQRELERGEKIMAELVKKLGFNPGSPKQLGEFLIGNMGLPVVKWNYDKQGNRTSASFDKYAMEEYDRMLSQSGDERARLVLTYRGWQKTTSSNYRPYLELLGPDGRLRPNYKQHGTHTGRLSCETPNLQQIPKESAKDWNGRLKRAFITERGRTPWQFDYSQLEFRLGAAYGRVSRLIDVFADPTRDVFTEMAKDLRMERQDVKTLTYTIQFGGGVTRIKDVFGVPEHRAKQIRDNFFKAYRGLQIASRKAQDTAWRNGGYIRYWTGRRRHFMDLDKEAHKAFNSAIQGGAFEITKRQMIKLMEAGLHNDECKIDLQVHDAIRADIEDGKEHIYIPEIKRIMEDVDKRFGVDFRVDVEKWGTKDKYQPEKVAA
jgi:DNA polymerase-1